MIIEIFFFTIVTIFAFSLYTRYGKNGRYIDIIPGPTTWPLISSIYIAFKITDVWKQIRKWDVEYYPIYKLWTTHWGAVFILHPDDIEKAFSNSQNSKKSIFYSHFHPWLRFGLLTSHGEKWRKRRKMLTPAFHFSVLQKYSTSIHEIGEETMNNLRLKSDAVHNVVDFVGDYTLRVICDTAMGFKIIDEKLRREYIEAVSMIGECIFYRFRNPWFLPDFSFYNFSEKGRDYQKALNTLHEFTNKMIREKKEFHEKTNGYYLNDSASTEDTTEDLHSGHRKKRLAMLDLLIAAQRNGNLIDDEGIQEEVDTFTFEGHDTTAMALSFAILLIAEHTDVQERIRDEICKIYQENNGKLNVTDIQRCSYLEMSIKECLRLYPSVQYMSRDVKEDLQLTNYMIPKGTILQVHIFSLHRDPNFWPDPEKFDPERFSADKSTGRHPFSYLPFSAGSRNCIGQKFAMLEMKIFMAQLLYNFQLISVDIAADVPLTVDIVGRPGRPIHVKLVPIDRN